MSELHISEATTDEGPFVFEHRLRNRRVGIFMAWCSLLGVVLLVNTYFMVNDHRPDDIGVVIMGLAVGAVFLPGFLFPGLYLATRKRRLVIENSVVQYERRSIYGRRLQSIPLSEYDGFQTHRFSKFIADPNTRPDTARQIGMMVGGFIRGAMGLGPPFGGGGPPRKVIRKNRFSLELHHSTDPTLTVPLSDIDEGPAIAELMDTLHTRFNLPKLDLYEDGPVIRHSTEGPPPPPELLPPIPRGLMLTDSADTRLIQLPTKWWPMVFLAAIGLAPVGFVILAFFYADRGDMDIMAWGASALIVAMGLFMIFLAVRIIGKHRLRLTRTGIIYDGGSVDRLIRARWKVILHMRVEKARSSGRKAIALSTPNNEFWIATGCGAKRAERILLAIQDWASRFGHTL